MAYAQVGVLPINWPVFVKQFIQGSEPPLLLDLISRIKDRAERDGQLAAEVLRELEAAPTEERKDILASHLRDQAIKVLGLDSSFRLDVKKPLNEMGLDSLMAIELKNAVGNIVGQDLPATLLFNYPTIDELAGYLVKEVLKVEDKKESPQEETVQETDTVLEEVEDLSDEDVEALLNEKLSAFDDID
jgi:polyketide synthase 12/myxalamid-type polyketide synthase MxaB